MLYIWMPETNGNWYWSTGENWQAATSVEQLSRHLSQYHQQDVVVFFPSRDIQVLQHKIPKAQVKKMGQEGIQYLLEEYVIVPVDQMKVMHHVSSPDQLDIVAIHHHQLETYLNALGLLPFKIVALLPDYLIAAYVENQTVITQIDGRILARESEFTGRSIDDLALYLAMHSADKAVQLQNLSDKQLQAADQATLDNCHVIDETTWQVPVKPKQHPFNMLPKAKSAQQGVSGYAKACVCVLAAALVVQFSYDALRWIKYKNNAELTAQQAVAQYQSWFGSNSRVSEQNLKSQFESHLRLNQAADVQALQLLNRVGPVLMQQKVVTQSLKYEAQQLQMDVKANSADSIRQLSQLLTLQGLKVELGNIQANAQGAIGQVKIQ